jgi:hypothetical protein
MTCIGSSPISWVMETSRARLDHALELGAPVIGRRRARLHIGFDELVAARDAIGFALALLVGDGDIVLGLPRRRDAQVKGGP